jgi:hypothetical protein
MATRTAKAVWTGTLREGQGTMNLEAAYGLRRALYLASRF